MKKIINLRLSIIAVMVLIVIIAIETFYLTGGLFQRLNLHLQFSRPWGIVEETCYRYLYVDDLYAPDKKPIASRQCYDTKVQAENSLRSLQVQLAEHWAREQKKAKHIDSIRLTPAVRRILNKAGLLEK